MDTYTKAAQEKMRAAGQHRPIHNSRHDKWNADRLEEVQRISERVEDERILGSKKTADELAKNLLKDLEQNLRLEIFLLEEDKLTKNEITSVESDNIG